MPRFYVCNMCGERKSASSSSLPSGEARCQKCRRLSPVRHVVHPLSLCPVCATEFTPKLRTGGKWTVVCSHLCEQRRRNPIQRSGDDRRSTRFERERSAPGLSQRARYALLRLWKRQGRSCAYCESSAAAVDHIVPLFRGGTSFEGNLAPVCLRCNSSKGTLFLVEWRARDAETVRVMQPGLRSAA